MTLKQLPKANQLAQDIEALQFRLESITNALKVLEDLTDVDDTVAIHIPNNHTHIDASELVPIFAKQENDIKSEIKQLTKTFENI